jgi:peptidylprolyl isomerase domain and WD repeat-containing protein 1
MHKSDVTHIAFAKQTNFLITASVDGAVKFWKKIPDTIEFVKKFDAHAAAVQSISLSPDGKNLATVGLDNMIKLYDVQNLDMYAIIKLDYTPLCVCWIQAKPAPLIAVSAKDEPAIYIYDGLGQKTTPLKELKKLHKKPILLMAYNPKYNCVVSVDEGRTIEHWTPDNNYKRPADFFRSKIETDLFTFKEHKSLPTCLTLSPDNEKFATFSFPDRMVRIFHFKTGKLHKVYNESIKTITAFQKADKAPARLDFDTPYGEPRDLIEEEKEFDRRIKIEEMIEQTPALMNRANVVFDETGRFILFGSPYGVKVLNTVSNTVAKVYGTQENFRPLNLALYQGAPLKKGIVTTAMAASDNPLLQEAETRDAMLVTAGFTPDQKGDARSDYSSRFYMFTNDTSCDIAM